MAAMSITALVALTGAAVDVGLMYSAKSECQNAADAAALAGAATLLSYDASGNASTDPSGATATAQEVSASNQGAGVSLGLLSGDVVLGKWDPETRSIDTSAGTAAPENLTAIGVTVRRDATANGPVDLFFSNIIGIPQASVSATAVGMLGYAGSVQEGQADLPIAVHADALRGSDGPNCGAALEFHDENNENAEWTTFFSWPTNDPNVKRYVNGSTDIPELSIGDIISVINGNLSNNTFRALQDRFQSEGVDTDGDGNADEWQVLLPVVENTGATSAEIVGFAYMIITGVDTAPYKHITGYLQCDMVVDGSVTGGEDFGARATRPILVNNEYTPTPTE